MIFARSSGIAWIGSRPPLPILTKQTAPVGPFCFLATPTRHCLPLSPAGIRQLLSPQSATGDSSRPRPLHSFDCAIVPRELGAHPGTVMATVPEQRCVGGARYSGAYRAKASMMAFWPFAIENMNRLCCPVGTALRPIIGDPPIIEPPCE